MKKNLSMGWGIGFKTVFLILLFLMLSLGLSSCTYNG